MTTVSNTGIARAVDQAGDLIAVYEVDPGITGEAVSNIQIVALAGPDGEAAFGDFARIEAPRTDRLLNNICGRLQEIIELLNLALGV